MAYQTLVTFSDISMVKLENNTTVQLKPKIYRRYVNMFSRRKVNTAGNCMFKVNNRNTRTRCEICSKLTIKTPERSPSLLLLTLNM